MGRQTKKQLLLILGIGLGLVLFYSARGALLENMTNINPDFEPAYLKLHRSGELEKTGKELWNIMQSCQLCPRKCGVNRLKGEKGFCQADSQLVISSYHPHFGEERPLVGKGGSGTIFFGNCGSGVCFA